MEVQRDIPITVLMAMYAFLLTLTPETNECPTFALVNDHKTNFILLGTTLSMEWIVRDPFGDLLCI